MYASEANSANFGLPAVSSRISIGSFFARLVKSVSEEFERLRFLGRCGDLVSGGFRCLGRPLLGEILLLWEARMASPLEVRWAPTLVIGEAEKLSSAEAPKIDSDPEGV